MRALLVRAVGGPHAHPGRGRRDLGHLHAQAQISAGGHRVHQPPVASVRHVAEVVPAVFELVPHPAQRLASSKVGGLGLDASVQHLARPPRRARRQAGPGHERLDPVRRGRLRPELGGQLAGRLREALKVETERLPRLRGREAASLAAVKAGDLRHRVRRAAGNADLVREGTHRVPDRHVDPRPAQVDRRAAHVNRVQPAADPVAGLHHHALNPTVRQRVRDRQPGDPRTDHHHALDRPRHSPGNLGPPVVEILSGQSGHPLRPRAATLHRAHGTAAVPRCGKSRAGSSPCLRFTPGALRPRWAGLRPAGRSQRPR